MAKPKQVKPLLLFIKTKITGKARDQIDIHCNLTTWLEISELLLKLYQCKKSLDQLLQELHNIKQGPSENVTEFYQRLEDLSSKALGAVHASNIREDTLPGRLSMIKEITLNRSIHHSHPQISQMLRYKDFDIISDAHTAAKAEEKSLKLNATNGNVMNPSVKTHIQFLLIEQQTLMPMETNFQQRNFRVTQSPLKPPIQIESATMDFNKFISDIFPVIRRYIPRIESDIEGSESDTGENVEDTADSTENDEWIDVSEVDNIPSPIDFDISPRIAGLQISNDIKERRPIRPIQHPLRGPARFRPFSSSQQYADDTVCWASGPSLYAANNSLQEHLSSLESWMRRWRIKPNPNKTQLIQFRHHHKRTTLTR
ncbi:hypothetical protein CBL_20846 [Carabus blaptoides fortunei]